MAGFAESVAAAGDLDGDGKHDWWVADSELGFAWLVFADPSKAAVRIGMPTRGAVGSTDVHALDDVDADGISDVLIATGAGSLDRPRVYSSATGKLLREIDGDRAAVLGDLDGDGRSDILSSRLVKSRTGEDLVTKTTFTAFSGTSWKRIWTVENTWDLRAAIDVRITSAGDVDGDDISDWCAILPSSLIVGSGKSGAWIASFEGAWGSSPASFCAMGDMDGDRRADVLVAFTPGTYTPLSSVRIHSSTTESVLLTKARVCGECAASACCLGDVDGDGAVDFALGSRGNAGSQIGIYSGRAGTLLAAEALVVECEGFLAVCPRDMVLERIPDVNGDGFDDLLVGLPCAPRAIDCEGEVRVVSGKSARVLRSIRRCDLMRPSAPSGR